MMTKNGRTNLETATGLSRDAATEISDALRELLADVFTLYTATAPQNPLRKTAGDPVVPTGST